MSGVVLQSGLVISEQGRHTIRPTTTSTHRKIYNYSQNLVSFSRAWYPRFQGPSQLREKPRAPSRMRLLGLIKLLAFVAVCMAAGGIFAAWKNIRMKELSREKAGQLKMRMAAQIETVFPRSNHTRHHVLIKKPVNITHNVGGDVHNSVRDADNVHNADKNQTREGVDVFIDIDQGTPNFDELFRHLVVVTAFSENHYREALGMIGSAQKSMPQTHIVVYDIGIKEATLPKVKKLCNVEVRKFQFQKYPSFASNLATYSWKVFIIKEALNEFGAIFWADASVRFKKSLKKLLPFAHEHHGYLSRIHSYSALTKTPIKHNYYMTFDETFRAIGVDRAEYSRSAYAPHLASNRQLIINGSTIQQNFLRPMYTCAADKNCISPPGAKHAVNHRFDSSALMLVIYKYFPGEFSVKNDHAKDMDDVMYMHRASNDWRNAKSC